MSRHFELSIEISEPYDFSKEGLSSIDQNPWVKNQWPLVYFIRHDDKKLAYVGETTNASARIRNHLGNKERLKLNKISIIGSDKFNKSATLDIEAQLIQYLFAEQTYELQNGNHGLVNHKYYQQDLYHNLFREIWTKLMERKIVTKSLKELENTDLFKYSPYKSLNEDQYKSALEILAGLSKKERVTIFVRGSAGTGKTILATYLIKLLNGKPVGDVEEYNEDELKELQLIKKFQEKYPDAKIGLVIAMTSLRKTLQKVFRSVPGLKASMVISPSEVANAPEPYDLLFIDEAHRLRRYKNIVSMGVFKQNNQKLGFDDSGTELDWLLKKSKSQIFFYDIAQSIKPSDVEELAFAKLLQNDEVLQLELKSQMRVKGGADYLTFVDELLQAKKQTATRFEASNYELLLFDSLDDLYKLLAEKEKEFGLCRLVAGYAWRWISNPKIKPTPTSDTFDIELDGLKFKWNSVTDDWVNSPNAFYEIGCVHTTQGYDLNYTGVIFGREITYNKSTGAIEIRPENYHDINGKKGISNKEELKNYIINIYKTIMYRGIRGTFVYACDPSLREYLKLHLQVFKKPLPFRVLPLEKVRPFVNSVPLIDITAAAGNFSELQIHESTEWIELPTHIAAKKGYFVCKVEGESMNKVIPNNSYCLFKQDEGGSREGKIVLVQSTHIQDSDFGSGYTVKEYSSEKTANGELWRHQTIILKPRSYDPSYKNLVLTNDQLVDFKVVGIFECVL